MYITMSDAVTMTGLSRQRIYQLVRAGRIKRKLQADSTRARYSRDDLIRHRDSIKAVGGRPRKGR